MLSAGYRRDWAQNFEREVGSKLISPTIRHTIQKGGYRPGEQLFILLLIIVHN